MSIKQQEIDDFTSKNLCVSWTLITQSQRLKNKTIQFYLPLSLHVLVIPHETNEYSILLSSKGKQSLNQFLFTIKKWSH